MSDDVLAPALSEAVALRTPRAVPGSRISERSDDEIIGLVRDGDTNSFGLLVRRYEDFVYTLVRGIVLSDETAKDVAQETFLRAYRGIRRFQSKSSFKTWLYRIAYNTSMSHLKERAVKTEPVNEEIEPAATRNGGALALKITLQRLIGLLKPELKAVMIFHYYDDLKYEEIAAIMNCPVGTVKVRLFRAKHELRKLWDRYAIQLPRPG